MQRSTMKKIPIKNIESKAKNRPAGYKEDVFKYALHIDIDCGFVLMDEDTFKMLREKWTPSRGLGDTIKKVTDKLGIKQCGGCKKNQEILNKAVPYKD